MNLNSYRYNFYNLFIKYSFCLVIICLLANINCCFTIGGQESEQLFDATSLRRTHNLSGRASSRNVLDIANDMKSNGYDGPPIDVVKDDDGNMYVVDGHHRLAAAKMTNTPVKINIVNDIASHPSSYKTIDEVINDSFFVGKDKLRLGR